MRSPLTCFLLVLTLSAVLAVRELENLDDLKDACLNPQGLRLLYWFSRRVRFYDNNWMTGINPNINQYGCHQFYNNENLLPTARNNYFYYIIGNLNSRRHPGANDLPGYITVHYRRNENIDRLIIRGSNREDSDSDISFYINAVYSTQHIQNSNDYDPDRTFYINNDLIRQIANLSPDSFEDYFSMELFSCRRRQKRQSWYRLDTCDVIRIESCQPQLEVHTLQNGNAKIVWRGVSGEGLNSNAWVGLFKNDDDPADDSEYNQYLDYNWVYEQESGSYKTSVPMTHGLNVRLFTERHGNSVWRGPEVSDSCGKAPVKIRGFDALLQLIAKDGCAYARLFIRKSFTDWTSKFSHAWVGFYSPVNNDSENPDTYAWAIYFNKDPSKDLQGYDVYISSSYYRPIAPKVDVRFFLDSGYEDIRARTELWCEVPSNIE